jgi:hypothetical protein
VGEWRKGPEKGAFSPKRLRRSCCRSASRLGEWELVGE